MGALAAAFKSMTLGPVGLVSPVISTEGAFATLFGLALGETVGGATGLALAVIVIGIVLSAIDRDPLGGSMRAASAVNRTALSIALASAVLFAVSLVAASRATRSGCSGRSPSAARRVAADHDPRAGARSGCGGRPAPTGCWR